jgi:hypothetical protein
MHFNRGKSARACEVAHPIQWRMDGPEATSSVSYSRSWNAQGQYYLCELQQIADDASNLLPSEIWDEIKVIFSGKNATLFWKNKKSIVANN